jgi:PAS domain S-box-containing protein
MECPDAHSEGSATAAEQVNDLFDAAELATALDTADFRRLLDYVPISLVISKLVRGGHRIVYVNRAFEALLGRAREEICGRDWSILGAFRNEDDSALTLSHVLPKGEDYLGTFHFEGAKPALLEAYATVIQDDCGSEHYHITALVDVTERAKAHREELARRIRDKDLLLREIQHRVKNNLQLITTLIRLEARHEAKGDNPNLERLAGRIEALQCLYDDLSNHGGHREIDLGHYLSRIASAVVRTHGIEGIHLNTKVENASVSINVAMPLGLVVNELLTNAFKHAFVGRDTGSIAIECLRREGIRWQIVVADDGVGLPEGVHWPPDGKLSTLMVQTLRENANADICVTSTPGNGTRVTISITDQAATRRAA